MTVTDERPTAIGALDQRLRAVATVLGVDLPSDAPDPVVLLETLIASCSGRAESDRVWLLLVGVTAQFPTAETLRGVRRRIELSSPRNAATWIMQAGVALMSSGDAAATIEIETERPVVDVDFTATDDLSTGIQRVVRELLPRWRERFSFVAVRWAAGKAFARLQPEEERRVFGSSDTATAGPSMPRLVPWRVPVILPEVPFPEQAERLVSLAEFSPNPVRAVGYDCIPVVSADLVGPLEHEKFGAYLELVKHLDVVAAISASATGEFAGFLRAVQTQGLGRTRLVTCGLPTEVSPGAGSGTTVDPAARTVLSVGSLARRKNQILLVEASEHLWREGLEFDLHLVGSGGDRPQELLDLIDDLRDAGRAIAVDERVSDAELAAAYLGARIVVFPSLHEGFGLPVVEALSYGVPVITSDYGSTQEIAVDGGVLLVDPEDVEALTTAMRQLLADDHLHTQLSDQAVARPVRTWDDYAQQLWESFIP